MVNRRSIQSLVESAQSGDQEALDRLCKELAPFIRSGLMRVFRDQELVKDLSQETYLRLVKSYKNLNEPVKIRSFVGRIIAFVINDYYRGQQYRHDKNHLNGQKLDEPIEQLATTSGHEDHVLNALALEKIRQHLTNNLDRKIIKMRLTGLKYGEISKELNISVELAKKRYQRALHFLGKKLQ